MTYSLSRLCILACLGLLLTAPAVAQAKGYSLNLFYDTESDTLRADKFAEDPVTVEEDINLVFDEVTGDESRGDYKLEFVAPQYTLSSAMYFEVQDGAFTLEAPYLSHVRRLRLVNPEGNVVNTFSVSGSAVCNQNNVCEYENGETKDTCVLDCVGENVTFSDQTRQTLQEQNGVVRNREGEVLLEDNNVTADDETDSTASDISNQQDGGGNLLTLIGGILLIGGAAGVWIYLTFAKSKE